MSPVPPTCTSCDQPSFRLLDYDGRRPVPICPRCEYIVMRVIGFWADDPARQEPGWRLFCKDRGYNHKAASYERAIR